MRTANKKLVLAMLSLFAVYGCQSDTQEEAPVSGEDQLVGFKGSVDHAAIVEGGTIMLTTNASFAPADPALDAFNQEDPFHIGPAFRETFAKNLIKFDAVDGKTDWSPAQAKIWIDRLGSSNYIVIDTSKPCGDFADPHTYLEIERAQLTGAEHKTCGGRLPNEDAFDVTVNFLARGPGASTLDADALSDGVDHATKQSLDAFPYLADLN